MTVKQQRLSVVVEKKVKSNQGGQATGKIVWFSQGINATKPIGSAKGDFAHPV
jgi:hypothetical protein